MTGLGHEVIAREVDVREVGAVTTRERPDVAFVGLGLSFDHALELITEIVVGLAVPLRGAIAIGAAKGPPLAIGRDGFFGPRFGRRERELREDRDGNADRGTGDRER